MAQRSLWIWVPVAMIAIAILAWIGLALMPFSREPLRRTAPQPVEVVTEGRADRTATVEVIGEVDPPAPPVADAPGGPPLPQEMSESEAAAALQRFLVSSGTVSGACAVITLVEYKNRGYTFEVRDRCGARSHGRWRIDSEDLSGRGVFRQYPDGRYLRP